MAVVFGSANETGHTANFLKRFLEFFPDFKITEVNAFKENVKPCIGCNVCKNTFDCVYGDMNKIYDILEKSSVMVFASPVYNASFPSPLKAIIDRMQKYYFARKKANEFSQRKKSFVLLLTQGCKTSNYEEIIYAQINSMVKILNAECKGILVLKGTDDEKTSVDKFYIKSENEVMEIVNKIRGDFGKN